MCMKRSFKRYSQEVHGHSSRQIFWQRYRKTVPRRMLKGTSELRLN